MIFKLSNFKYITNYNLINDKPFNVERNVVELVDVNHYFLVQISSQFEAGRSLVPRNCLVTSLAIVFSASFSCKMFKINIKNNLNAQTIA